MRLFTGFTDRFFSELRQVFRYLHSIDTLPPIVILRLRNMTAIDATGLGAIRDLADSCKLRALPAFVRRREQPSQLMKQSDFERHVGEENICASITEALQRAAEIYRMRQAIRTRDFRRKQVNGEEIPDAQIRIAST